MKRSDVLAEAWRDALLGIARAFLQGELPPAHAESFKENAEFCQAITLVADSIRQLGADSTMAELQLAVEGSVPHSFERQHWAEFTRAANFLKHADADHEGDFVCDAGLDPIWATPSRNQLWRVPCLGVRVVGW